MSNDDPLLVYRTEELQCGERYFACRHTKGNRLLEIGAGTGHQARELTEHGFHVDAIDLDCSPYSEARVFPIAGYNGRRLPFDDASFDVVYSSNVLEHVESLEELLTEAARVLKPGGVAVHIMPTPAWRFWSLVTHFPWVIQRAIAISTGRVAPEMRELGRPMTNAGLLQTLISVIPRRHGEHGTLLGELWSYRRHRWIAEIRRSGLQPAGDRPAGLFYTGPQIFGTRLSLPWRRKLASVLGSAVHIYCFLKPPVGSAGVAPRIGTAYRAGRDIVDVD
jgi:SAM-dependent methyltransferase